MEVCLMEDKRNLVTFSNTSRVCGFLIPSYMKRHTLLFSLATIAILLLVGCSSNQQKPEQTNVSDSTLFYVDSVTLYGYYLNLKIATLAKYDGEARDQILHKKTVNENQGYLECHVISEQDGDNFTVKIHKINVGETIMVHSSGFMDRSEIPTDDFQVFQFTDSSWQTNKTALTEVTLAQFYGTQEIPDANIFYAYEFNPSSLELNVKLIKADYSSPNLTDADSATQAYLKKLDSNEYSELVMNWNNAASKFLVKERTPNKGN
jgi:hypothetical protein